MSKRMLLGLALLCAAALTGCESEPDGRCQMWIDCCTALQGDARFSAHDVVEAQCPPQGDMSEGDRCYQGRTQMISDIVGSAPVLREFVPSQCM
ncbi:MAG: hypothetical protein M5U28_29985 [Sandaracinaceae bacterium]|nr:hypothetical protein [Sandaracinaceae bacterium]